MSSDSLLGKQLDEYKLEEMLGRGGMARVYRALDVRLDRYVAIKVIDTPFRTEDDYVMRFEREAQAIGKLEHPNIVRLYRYGEVDGLLYMAMQYVNGASLRYVLDSYAQDGEYIEPEEAERILTEVCHALDYAHSQGVIHRDIKPANIMLDTNGRALLTDFGLALMTEVGTRGEIFGSPHYIAPEQAISSAGAVPQSDFYSVGIMMYEMFTGQVPFDAPEPLDIAAMHLSDEPTPPSDLRPEVSRQLERVIMRALFKEPEDRFADGSALASALSAGIETSTMSRPEGLPPSQTIPERVALEIANNPLPPPPAAVTPTAQPTPPRDAPHVTMASPPAEMQQTATPQGSEGGLPVALLVGGGLIGVIVLGLLLGGLLFGRQMMGAGDDSTPPPSATAASETEAPAATEPAVLPTDQPTVTPAPTEVPPTATVSNAFVLRIEKRGDDSMFLINDSQRNLPLGNIVLEGGGIEFPLTRWNIDVLAPGECLTAWKQQGNPGPADDECQQVGRRVEQHSRDIFWKESFVLRLETTVIGMCEANQETCIFMLEQ